MAPLHVHMMGSSIVRTGNVAAGGSPAGSLSTPYVRRWVGGRAG